MVNSSSYTKFNRRLIVSGKVIEYFEYERLVVRCPEKERVGRRNAAYTSAKIKADNREKTAQRAKQTVRRTINANPQLNKFLTLTFAENVKDLSKARYEFDKFIKRLKTRYEEIKYINVVEFQKRGAVHFHLLCNLPYVDVNEVAQIWQNGFIKINRIENVDNVGAYVTKYMTKGNIDERLIGRKCYSMSKGLNEPNEYIHTEEIDEILENIEDVKRVYTNEFKSEYYGAVRYTQVICESPPKKPLFRLFRRLRARGCIPLPDNTETPFDEGTGRNSL